MKLITPLLEEHTVGKTLNPLNRSKAEAIVSEVFDVNPVVARIRLQEMFPADGQKFL